MSRRFTRYLILVSFLGAGAAEAYDETADVKIFAVGPFGETLQDCRVDLFTKLRSNLAYPERFNGLLGHNIPFGDYLVSVICRDNKGGSSIVRISRKNAFVVVCSTGQTAHFPPNRAPKMEINVEASGARFRWIKLAGTYIGGVETAEVDPRTGAATFINVQPARYWLTLFEDGTLVCSGAIDVMGPRAALKVTLSSEGCEVTPKSLVRLVK